MGKTKLQENIYFQDFIKVDGSIKGDVIDGNIEGNVVTSTDLTISKSGSIRGSVKAQNAVIFGTVYGNVDILGKLELSSTAKIYGDIRTKKLIINPGAVFNGSCHMRENILRRKMHMLNSVE